MKEQVVKEWIERGKHDLDAAKILLAEEEYSDIVLFHIHQAVEKYLKGYLIYNGWGLKKIHDIELLITEALSFNEEFQKYLDLGRKLNHLGFDDEMHLVSEVPGVIDIPAPIIFDASVHNIGGNCGLQVAMAAEKIDTFAIFPAEEINPDITKYSDNIIPLFSYKNIREYPELIKNSGIVEIEYSDEINNFDMIKKIKKISGAIVIIRVPAAADVESKITELAKKTKAFVVPEINYGQIVFEVARCSHGHANVVLVPHGGAGVHVPDDIADAIEYAAKEEKKVEKVVEFKTRLERTVFEGGRKLKE